MLGKGLESLIPNKSVPSHKPVVVPAAALPAEPEYKELVSPEDLLRQRELPAGDVHDINRPEVLNISYAPPPPAEKVSHSSQPLSSQPRSNRVSEAIFQIEVDKIRPNPHQPRRNFDEAAIKELAASIREFGVLQPIVVTKVERDVETGTEVEYELVAGERRLMATKLLGFERIPAIITSVGQDRERLELAIIENLQRENLNAVEMARAFSRLQDEFRLTQREIASRLGRSRESVANTMRLLDLPPAIQKAIEDNQITESHGRLLLAVENPGAQQKIFSDLLGTSMTTRELKSRVHEAAERARQSAPESELHIIQEHLSAKLKAPVNIVTNGASGKITISFYSEEELHALMDQLGGEM